MDRKSYKFTSKTSDAEKKSTQEAVLSKNFRQAINFAYDRTAYEGPNLKEKMVLLRSYVTWLFLQTFVTVVNGKDFGEVVSERW